MAIGLIGRKKGMTQVFSEQGELIPVTVIEAGPCVVVQKMTEEKDGYEAVQLGFEKVKPKKLNKPERGVFEKRDLEPHKHLKEFRDDVEEYEIGDELDVELFAPGDFVDVSGITKGKGFSGNTKRYGHSTGPASHGFGLNRAPGSVGALGPERVFKGQKMPGRMGHDRTTIKNLKVVRVMPERDVILVKGSVPGPEQGIVEVKRTE